LSLLVSTWLDSSAAEGRVSLLRLVLSFWNSLSGLSTLSKLLLLLPVSQ